MAARPVEREQYAVEEREERSFGKWTYPELEAVRYVTNTLQGEDVELSTDGTLLMWDAGDLVHHGPPARLQCHVHPPYEQGHHIIEYAMHCEEEGKPIRGKLLLEVCPMSERETMDAAWREMGRGGH